MTLHGVATDRLGALSAAGVSVWLDDLNRERVLSGGLTAMVRDRHIVGVTTNPTIFASAITGSNAYRDQIHDLRARAAPLGEALRELTATDVRCACDILRSVYDATDGVDGRVSIEVDPRLADDTDGTRAEARALWWLVDRPNLYIKIPATPASIPAITACLAEGISVNVTLIFSLSRYDEVMNAFLDGLEAAHRAGRELSRIGSVASFFISRVDTEIDRRLDRIGTAAATGLRGRAATANARLAYSHYERMIDSPRWQALAAVGGRPQRPLWASTSGKDPRYRDTRYVEDLVAPGVVVTVPEATLDAVADHGEFRAEPIAVHYPEAHRVIVGLAAVGIDYDDVVRTLEDQAVALFQGSWQRLGEQLGAALAGELQSDGKLIDGVHI